jgi:ribonuclease HI
VILADGPVLEQARAIQVSMRRPGIKSPVKNQPWWEQLDTLGNERQIEWVWVSGHAGHEQNERVDGLANAGARRAAEEVAL